MRGVVSSNKMMGVVAVTVERFVIHPIYKRRLRRSKTFLASTDAPLNVGDQVEIKETRPQSRRVRFAVASVTLKATVLPEVKEEKVGKEKKVIKKVAKKVEEPSGPTA